MWQSKDALQTINLVKANVPNANSFGIGKKNKKLLILIWQGKDALLLNCNCLPRKGCCN
jgi:hypothetical protein